MLGDFVELFQKRSRIVSLATTRANTNRYMLKNIEHVFPAQIDSHATLSHFAAAFLTSVVLHNLFRKHGNDSKHSGFRQPTNQIDCSSVGCFACDNKLTALAPMPLSLGYSTRINRIFHVGDGKSVLFHLFLRMSGKLILAECDLSPELVDF